MAETIESHLSRPKYQAAGDSGQAVAPKADTHRSARQGTLLFCSTATRDDPYLRCLQADWLGPIERYRNAYELLAAALKAEHQSAGIVANIVDIDSYDWQVFRVISQRLSQISTLFYKWPGKLHGTVLLGRGFDLAGCPEDLEQWLRQLPQAPAEQTRKGPTDLTDQAEARAIDTQPGEPWPAERPAEVGLPGTDDRRGVAVPATTAVGNQREDQTPVQRVPARDDRPVGVQDDKPDEQTVEPGAILTAEELQALLKDYKDHKNNTNAPETGRGQEDRQ